MNDSLFDETMVNMTYQEIEKLIQEEAIVLLPVTVIEEHGPHLPLGTDTYITYSILKRIQNELNESNVKSVIAPPFYWGINSITNGFPGSFTVKVDTMKAVLKDTIDCLHNWGFGNVYVLNTHGDFLHNKTILETVMELNRQHSDNKKVFDIIPEYFKASLGLNGSEPYALIPTFSTNEEEQTSKIDENPYLDLHAGGFETSFMLLEFKELVNEEVARSLKSSKTTFDLVMRWRRGGAEAREITPLGYCGDPSNIDLQSAKAFIEYFSKVSAKLIVDSL